MDYSAALNWLFEWVAAEEARTWLFVVVCVVAVLMGAAASLLELGVEFGASAVVGLLVAAHSGFFLGLIAFTLLFLGLYIYMGRGARVSPTNSAGDQGA